MMDRLVAIRDKLLAFWNRYTTKQKTIIICVALAILFAIVLLAYFLTRPVYVDLVTLNADAASEFREQLDAAGVDYEDEAISTDRVRFRVEQGQYSDAVVVMGANQITDSEGMSWEDALEEDMTTTSQVRSAKIDLALQSSIRNGLLTFDGNIATAFEPGEDLIQVYAGEDPIPVCVQRVVITEQTLITELEVPSSYLCLSEGDETVLSVRYSPEDATNSGEIRWQSVDPDIAEISNGILTAKGVGTTEIYVYTPEVERKIDVEVQAHLQDIVLSHQ